MWSFIERFLKMVTVLMKFRSFLQRDFLLFFGEKCNHNHMSKTNLFVHIALLLWFVHQCTFVDLALNNGLHHCTVVEWWFVDQCTFVDLLLIDGLCCWVAISWLMSDLFTRIIWIYIYKYGVICEWKRPNKIEVWCDMWVAMATQRI